MMVLALRFLVPGMNQGDGIQVTLLNGIWTVTVTGVADANLYETTIVGAAPLGLCQ